MPTYEQMFEKFKNIVETTNYPKFSSVLLDMADPKPYLMALHELFCNASAMDTRYDSVPEDSKFYDLIQLTRDSYPANYNGD